MSVLSPPPLDFPEPGSDVVVANIVVGGSSLSLEPIVDVVVRRAVLVDDDDDDGCDVVTAGSVVDVVVWRVVGIGRNVVVVDSAVVVVLSSVVVVVNT